MKILKTDKMELERDLKAKMKKKIKKTIKRTMGVQPFLFHVILANGGCISLQIGAN